MKSFLILLLLGCTLSACDSQTSSKKTVQMDLTTSPPKTIIDDQLKALDKAKDVERQIQEAAEKQRKALDEMTK